MRPGGFQGSSPVSVRRHRGDGKSGRPPEGLDLLRDGGTYVVAGHYADAEYIPLNPHVHVNRKYVDLCGQWGTDLRHLVCALRMLDRHGDTLPFERMIGARYPLERAGEALRDVRTLAVTKAVMVP